jgi:hypothetical protein
LEGAREDGGKPTFADRRSAWIQKHDIVRHQAEQAGEIACVHRINPGSMHLTDRSFIKFHLQPPLLTSS